MEISNRGVDLWKYPQKVTDIHRNLWISTGQNRIIATIHRVIHMFVDNFIYRGCELIKTGEKRCEFNLDIQIQKVTLWIIWIKLWITKKFNPEYSPLSRRKSMIYFDSMFKEFVQFGR